MFIAELDKLLDENKPTHRRNNTKRRCLWIWFIILIIVSILSAILVLALDFPKDIKIAIGITTFAGCAALIGGTSVFCVDKAKFGVIPLSLSFSAGVIVYLCLLNLIPEAINEFEYVTHEAGTAHLYCTLCVVSGIMIMVAIECALSKLGIHDHGLDQFELTDVSYTVTGVTESQRKNEENDLSELELSHLSYSVAIALILHHFPEGIATFVALYHDLKFGALIAFALAVHDIPSGICIAVPTYLSTGSMLLPFFLCYIAAITYPIGAFVGWAVVATTSDAFIEVLNGILFGVTSGIMLYISFIELLPKALTTAKYYNKMQHSRSVNMETVSFLLFFIGFLVMDTSNIIIKFTDAHH